MICNLLPLKDGVRKSAPRCFWFATRLAWAIKTCTLDSTLRPFHLTEDFFQLVELILVDSLTAWIVGDMVSTSSSSERSAMLTELRSAMSSISSSPVNVVRVLPKAFSLFPMFGSMWTSIPHIFHNTFSVQVPALLLSVFKEINQFKQFFLF